MTLKRRKKSLRKPKITMDDVLLEELKREKDKRRKKRKTYCNCIPANPIQLSDRRCFCLDCGKDIKIEKR